eukprot:g34329.t1
MIYLDFQKAFDNVPQEVTKEDESSLLRILVLSQSNWWFSLSMWIQMMFVTVSAVAHKLTSTLRQLLTRIKNPLPTMDRTNVIYKIPCRDCDKH